ncbi:MAG TPA: hypothetical protein VEA36_03865, partial [Candidatus Paceibacterota bacterium]|nr:hypothetical protein [Candidatus Paceibacterota bacterium]
MSLRTIIFVLILGALVLTIGSMAIAYLLMIGQVEKLFPNSSAVQAVDSLKLLFIQYSSILLAFITVIATIAFLILSRYIVEPVQDMVTAIQAFADRSERIDVAEFRDAPVEVAELAKVFNDFTIKVDDAHARDVEVSRMKSDFIS